MVYIELRCTVNTMPDMKGQNGALSFTSRLSQPKCRTSQTWPRSLASTRQSWRRRRQKRRTLFPPKRVSARVLHPLRQFFFSPSLPESPIITFTRTQQREQRSKRLQYQLHPPTGSLQCKPKPAACFCFLFFCSHWAGEERRCHTLTWAHEEKELRCHRKKSTFFWLSQYLNHLHCLQKRVLSELPGVLTGYFGILTWGLSYKSHTHKKMSAWVPVLCC